MESFKKITFLLLIVSLPLIFMHCTKYEEEAPFFDGLFLEYRLGGLKIIYEVEVLSNHKFKIVETEKAKVLSDDIEELFVDKYGKVYESSKKRYEGKFSPIWIPVHEIEIGDTISGGDFTAIRTDKWKGWDVLVLKADIVESENYHDLNTGFWVGSFARTAIGSGTVVLVNTNADIPTAEE